jgi:hypothetical protein
MARFLLFTGLALTGKVAGLSFLSLLDEAAVKRFTKRNRSFYFGQTVVAVNLLRRASSKELKALR